MGMQKGGATLPKKAGSSVSWVDILLAVFAMGAGIAAAVMVFRLLEILPK